MGCTVSQWHYFFSHILGYKSSLLLPVHAARPCFSLGSAGVPRSGALFLDPCRQARMAGLLRAWWLQNACRLRLATARAA